MKVCRVWNAAVSENARVLEASDAAMDEAYQVLRMATAQSLFVVLCCGC